MPELVVVDRLVKRYGPRFAVRGVSFSIDEGEIVGLLGPNGSGKSTILRILTGYLPPTAGSVRIGGLDMAEDSLAARSLVGYVPEDAPLYDGMRVGEFLHFMARIKGRFGAAAYAAVWSACERLHLENVVGIAIGKLSRGYRQRVAIAQALLNDPAILILDEPTNALDAYQVIAVRELIRSLAGRRTVLVASHVLTEIEKVASRIMIMLDGELLTTDAMREADRAQRFRLRLGGSPAAVLAELRKVAGVVAADIDTLAGGAAPSPPDASDSGGARAYLVEVASRPHIAEELARAAMERGFALSELVEVKPDLERVFLDLTRRAAQAEARAA